MAGSHYDVLKVSRNCTHDEIRRAYHRAVRALHPDKQCALEKPIEDSEELFLMVQTAYQVLADPQTRQDYDKQLERNELCYQRDVQDIRIADEILLSEMQWHVDTEDEEGSYSYPCRCGDVYEITKSDIEEHMDIVACNGCSLNIRILLSS